MDSSEDQLVGEIFPENIIQSTTQDYRKIPETCPVALTNEAILRDIFKNLSYPDVISCGQVNKIWAAAADSLYPKLCLYKIRFYSTNLKPSSQMREWEECMDVPPTPIRVEEINGLASKCRTCKFTEMYLEDLLEILRTSIKTHKVISIQLDILSIYFEFHEYEPVLSEFGSLIHSFNLSPGRTSITEFYRHLEFLPDLRILKWDSIVVYDQEEDFLQAPPIVDLPFLRRIYLGELINLDYFPDIQHQLIEYFSSVTEVCKVPFARVKQASYLGYMGILKSVKYPQAYFGVIPPKLNEFQPGLEILANENPELTQIAFVDTGRLFYSPSEENTGTSNIKNWSRQKLIANIRENFQKILQSSQPTLQGLTISPVESSNHYFPLPCRLNGTKTLGLKTHGLNRKLDCWMDLETTVGIKEKAELRNDRIRANQYLPKFMRKPPEFFPAKLNLKYFLPNLERIKVGDSLYQWDLLRYFPAKIFDPFKMQIKSLKLSGISPECLEDLAKLFPQIENLRMNSTVEHFPLIFPVIAKNWLRLKNLVIIFKEFCCENSHFEIYHGWESVLSGIPVSLCKTLLEANEGEYLQEGIFSAQDKSSSLFNLKDLKEIKFIIEDTTNYCRHCDGRHMPKVLTSLFVNQVLKKLPALKVIVAAQFNYRGEHCFERLAEMLSSIKDHIEIGFEFSTPEIYHLK